MSESKRNENYARRLISSYEARIRNNNIGLNMVLYFDNHIYEYNPDTYEIRPFNSFVWYTISGAKYDSIITKIRDEYNKVLLSNTKNNTMNTITKSSHVLNNTLIINLEEFRQDLKKYEEINELNKLIGKLRSIYDEWRKLCYYILDNYEGVDNILGFERIY